MLNRLVNYFLPEAANQDVESLRAYRIMVLVLMATGLLNMLYVNNAVAAHYSSVQYILLANGIACFLILFLLKKGVSRITCANLFQFNECTGILTMIWLSGGTNSTSTAGLLLVPMTAMLIAGRRNALLWLLICIVSMACVYWYETNVSPLPELFEKSQRDRLMLANIIGIMVALYMVTVVFDSEKERAVNNLILKNEELKATQQQLIQAEKLASLGELTAGIAHEIQNPLNFVNNFAEVSEELVLDMKTCLEDGQLDEVLTLTDYLSTNLNKIAHHGKRADSIVKGMLLHSRAEVGEKRPTNLNKLVDEYLRLAYQGTRAKDKSFNVELSTCFDASIGQLECAPQELGRVLLNLYNNAFYAIQQKQQLSRDGYQPQVVVTTRQLLRWIEVIVRDNGSGIPPSVVDKIFQPFFTTKPTGKGTGLGLSLSYDIITKGHGGELTVLSEEGAFTEFTIRLPLELVCLP